MSLYTSLGGVQVIEGRIVLPLVGACYADVTLAKEASPVAPLILGKLTMQCTAWRTPIPFQGKTQVRLIGGKNGWRTVLPAQGYSSPRGDGLRLSFILGACAKACGETLEIAPGSDRFVGRHYARERAAAAVHLNTLAPSWYIGVDGVTRIGARPATLIASAFTVVDYNGARGSMTIATDFPEDIIPGRTLKGLTISKPITIGGVVHTISAGKVRTEIYAS